MTADTNNGAAVAVRAEQKAAALAVRGISYTSEQINVIKSTVAVGASNEELGLFLTVAQRSGLDPFTKQIHFVKRYDSKQGREVGAFQVGIDGFRVIASRNPKYQGRVGPWWAGKDGVWRELWTDETPPFAAKVGIVVEGYAEPVFATARWSAYVQTKKDGSPNRFWGLMGPEQLAKCAEALALRIAFPNDLSGLYTHDEMGQADNGREESRPAQAAKPRQAAAAVTKQREVEQAAAASVAEVLGDDTGDGRDAVEVGTDAAPVVYADGHSPEMSAADRAEVLAQGSADDVLTALTALRVATKGERHFYTSSVVEGVTHFAVVDGELLKAIGRVGKNGAPVNTWLHQIMKSDKARLPFCLALIKVADQLGVEVVR
jgi:phage recombination protein Bet